MDALRAAVVGLVMLAFPAAATHAAPREFCPDRPDRANPPCVIEPGRIEAEASLVDWSLTRAPGTRQDQFLTGDFLVRTGLSRTIEARLGFTSYGFTRQRDPGGVTRQQGIGDVSLGVRWNLAHPDGNGASIALQPTFTLPTGGNAIGAGTWNFALALPASADLGGGFQLGFTPQVAAAANPDRRDRHLAYSAAFVLGHAVTRALAASVELYGSRDEGAGSADRASADAALALRVAPDTQLDVGAYIGLTPDTPDIEAIVGIARRF